MKILKYSLIMFIGGYIAYLGFPFTTKEYWIIIIPVAILFNA